MEGWCGEIRAFTNRELNQFIRNFQQQISFIDFNNEKFRNINLGWLGENIVGFCINHSMWGLGYSLNYNGHSGTFSIVLHYGANENNVGGVDIKLRFIDGKGNEYILLIEVKNWGYYPITQDMFNNEILTRYVERDSEGRCIWVVAIKRQSVRFIDKYCNKHTIRIVPLNDYLPPSYLMDYSCIRTTIICFIQDFTNLIESITKPEIDEVNLKEDFRGRTDLIIRDIELGKPYYVIAEKYNIKKSYIMKLASSIRSGGRKIPGRRSKAWARCYDKSTKI